MLKQKISKFIEKNGPFTLTSIFMLIGFVFIITGLSIEVISDHIHKKIKPNQIWMEVDVKDNPFKTPDTTYKKVIDVKRDWVLYEYKNIFNEKDTNSTTKRVFVYKSSLMKDK